MLNIIDFDITNYINSENYLVQKEKPIITTDLSQIHVVAGLDTLAIEGFYFGEDIGEVWFKNTEKGGNLFIKTLDSSFVVSWADTLIKVKIPSYIDYDNTNACAASGEIRINTATGRKGTSTTELNVDYSLTTHGQLPDYPIKRIYLAKLDCNNDMMFTLHNNVVNTPKAAACIDSALCHWSRKVNINLFLEKDEQGNYVTYNSTPTSSITKNIIWFDSDRDYGMGTVRDFNPNVDFDNNYEFKYYRSFTDIQIAETPTTVSGINWSYDMNIIPANTISFYQAFLHEIGHFLGLGHVSEPNGLMYYQLKEKSTESKVVNLDSISISKPDSAAMRVVQDSKNISWYGNKIGTLGAVNPEKPTIQASGDLISCLDSLILTSNHIGDNTWHPNNEKADSIVVSLNNDYALKVLKGGCTVYSDTITVKLKPQITRFMINNGAKSTGSTKVTLDNTCTNTPTDYLAYEEGNSGKWLPYSNKPYFNLSKVGLVKRVYLKVKRDNCESEGQFASIWYSPKKSDGKNKYTNSDNIRIYPNPVQGNLIIEYFNNSKVKLEIIDFTGKSILQNIFDDKISIDFSKFQSGVYFIKIVENSTIHTKKFIKQ